MIKSLLLVFDPEHTWDGIALAKRGVLEVCLRYLLPLLILVSLLEGYGQVKFGKYLEVASGFGQTQVIALNEAVAYSLLRFLFGLVVVFFGAYLLQALGETFHGRHNYAQAFCVVAYGLGPLFTLRAMNMFPTVPLWLPWTLGIFLVAKVLYIGIPRVMEPDPPHAFGLYLTSTLLLTMTTGLMNFISYWWMLGKFKTFESYINLQVLHLLQALHLM
jgi:hypothetical protein